MLFWFTLFLDVSGWAIRLAMVPVIALRQKNPTTCLAWLAIIFVLPWIGLLVYLLMGERSLGFFRVRERLKRCRAFDALHRLQWALPTFDDPWVRRDFEVLVQLAESHGGLPLLGGNRVDLLADVEGWSAAWHDVMVRISGPSARQMQMVFLEDWYLETGHAIESASLFPPAREEGGVALQIVPTGPDRPTEGFHDLLIQAIQSAQRKVVITSPYFIPSEGLLTALRLAVNRGVKVDLILPSRSDHLLVDLASFFYCGVLLECGANVYLFEDGMLHAKLLRVDDSVAMLGSANFDIRSFYLNLEVVLFLFDQGFLYRVRQLQSQYRRHSRKIDPAAWARRPLHRRLTEAMAKVFSPPL